MLMAGILFTLGVLILVISGCATPRSKYTLYEQDKVIKANATPADFVNATGENIELRRDTDNKTVFAIRDR